MLRAELDFDRCPYPGFLRATYGSGRQNSEHESIGDAWRVERRLQDDCQIPRSAGCRIVSGIGQVDRAVVSRDRARNPELDIRSLHFKAEVASPIPCTSGERQRPFESGLRAVRGGRERGHPGPWPVVPGEADHQVRLYDARLAIDLRKLAIKLPTRRLGRHGKLPRRQNGDPHSRGERPELSA